MYLCSVKYKNRITNKSTLIKIYFSDELRDKSKHDDCMFIK